MPYRDVEAGRAYHRQYMQEYREGLRRPAPPEEERFWVRVNKTDTCWLWTGALSKQGYGNSVWIRKGKRISIAAHRYAYELEYGPIPKGKVLDHLCMVKKCVRPAHLQPVSSQENTVRAMLTQMGVAVYVMPAFGRMLFVNTAATVVGGTTGVAALVISLVALFKVI